MTAVCCLQYLPCNPSHAADPPPPPPCAPSDIFMALVVAAPAALLIFWLRRNLHRPRLEQFAEEVPDHIPPRAEEAVAVGVEEAVGVEKDVGVDEDVPFGVEEAVAIRVAEAVAVGVEEAVAVGFEEAVGVGVGDEASRGELAPTFNNATVDRSAVVAGIRNMILESFGGIHLDIHSSDESTIHPATGVLMQSIEIFCENTDRLQSTSGTGDCTLEAYFVMFDCWVFKLKEDAERIFQGEKGRMCIFLLNNTYYVWQMMCYPGVPFSNVELTSRIISMIHRYRKSYLDECWVPLANTSRLGKFTLVFHTICECQMAWKVTAELRYTLRQEIADLILPSYELSLLAFKANQSPLSKILYGLKRSMAGKKKQRKLTVEALGKVIKELFEG